MREQDWGLDLDVGGGGGNIGGGTTDEGVMG